MQHLTLPCLKLCKKIAMYTTSVSVILWKWNKTWTNGLEMKSIFLILPTSYHYFCIPGGADTNRKQPWKVCRSCFVVVGKPPKLVVPLKTVPRTAQLESTYCENLFKEPFSTQALAPGPFVSAGWSSQPEVKHIRQRANQLMLDLWSSTSSAVAICF